MQVLAHGYTEHVGSAEASVSKPGESGSEAASRVNGAHVRPRHEGRLQELATRSPADSARNKACDARRPTRYSVWLQVAGYVLYEADRRTPGDLKSAGTRVHEGSIPFRPTEAHLKTTLDM